MQHEAIEKLTELQASIGYQPGRINAIALLGLLGESGEVAAEWIVGIPTFPDQPMFYFQRIKQIIAEFQYLDELKKDIRDKKLDSTSYFSVDESKINFEAFDEEIADVLYYLNALAVNRGKTLGEYAAMSHGKVSAKMLNRKFNP
jgi:hypothetical protein